MANRIEAVRVDPKWDLLKNVPAIDVVNNLKQVDVRPKSPGPAATLSLSSEAKAKSK